MTKTHVVSLIIAIVVSLVVGVIAGFFLGAASTKAGKAFLNNILENEQKAEVSRPKTLVRDRFQLQYPSNWRIKVDDEDYDPDAMFSIESPGSAFVMFVIGAGETKPEDTLQSQIRPFEKLMNRPVVTRFERYGRFTGKGAILKGKVMGIRTTTRLFSLYQNGLTVMVTEQCPDEDLKPVQPGLSLIEKSFSLMADKSNETPKKPAPANGKQRATR
jgi:hypothetical protein